MNVFYPAQALADWFTYSIAGLNPHSHAAEVLNFFVFDSLKIFALLAAIVFAVAYLRSFLPPEKIRAFLMGKPTFIANILAAVFGIATPFCTCSAIPLFLGFLQTGVPLGATFSFLVSSPMVNEVALALLFSAFGWKIALTYAASGVAIATLSGMAIGKMKVENLLADFVIKKRTDKDVPLGKLTAKQRLTNAWRYTLEILHKVWPFVLVGIGIGSWIHGYVPVDTLAGYAGADKWYAVPLATLLGIPLYSNAAGILPLIGVLQEKGVAMGTILAFMMAVTALSLPEFMILKKIMKSKLIIIFASTVGLGIMLTGYLFNAIFK